MCGQHHSDARRVTRTPLIFAAAALCLGCCSDAPNHALSGATVRYGCGAELDRIDFQVIYYDRATSALLTAESTQHLLHFVPSNRFQDRFRDRYEADGVVLTLNGDGAFLDVQGANRMGPCDWRSIEGRLVRADEKRH